MFTIQTANFELVIKSKKVALEIAEQLTKQDYPAKVVMIKEITS